MRYPNEQLVTQIDSYLRSPLAQVPQFAADSEQVKHVLSQDLH